MKPDMDMSAVATVSRGLTLLASKAEELRYLNEAEELESMRLRIAQIVREINADGGYET